MRVLVMSDTHGNLPAALQAYSQSGQVETVIHLGDGNEDAEILSHALDVPVIRVAGNCDIGSPAQRELLWECEGKKILITHGDIYGVKRGLKWLEQRGAEVAADAVLFGHTHNATVTSLSGVLAVNPGTLMNSSAGATFAILEISSQGITACLHPL